MSDSLFGVLLIIGAGLLAWHLIVGFQTGNMETLGMPFAQGDRQKSPIRFWLCALHNLFFAAGFAIISIIMLAKQQP